MVHQPKRVKASELQGCKYFGMISEFLPRLQNIGAERDKSGNRELFCDQYLSLLLLYFFSPAVTSLKALQQATELEKVQKLLGVKRVSLGSLSEAGSVFDPQPVRLVVIAATDDDGQPIEMWLLTDRLTLPAEFVGLAYRYRWTVELFFRWLKQILGCRHLVSTKEKGVAMQLYAALIASLLVVLWTGLKANKRTWEMLQYDFTGWATAEELERHIQQQLARQERAAHKTRG